MKTIIVGVDDNFLMGAGDKLPWNIPEDLLHFKNTTLNHPVIMGSKTYWSLPRRPLPNRTNIIISRKEQTIDGGVVFNDMETALTYGESISNQVFIIGGGEIYRQTINLVDRMIITHVKGAFEGDCYFPRFNLEEWKQTILREHDKFTIIQYDRS